MQPPNGKPYEGYIPKINVFINVNVPKITRNEKKRAKHVLLDTYAFCPLTQTHIIIITHLYINCTLTVILCLVHVLF